MKRKGVPHLVEEILLPYFEEEGYELYSVAFVKESGRRYLRVAADRPSGGFNINDCEKISIFLSKRLDELDPVKEKYFLEVSSPGAERVFKHESDFIRFRGHRIHVTLNQMLEGQKLITGKLLSKEDDILRMIDEATDEELKLSMDQIKQVKNILEV